jgi:hypothetical protein
MLHKLRGSVTEHEAKAVERAVWGLLVHAVETALAPKVVLAAWVDLGETGRAFVVARLDAMRVTAETLRASKACAEHARRELRRVAAAARMWVARFDRVAPLLVKLVAARMVEVGALGEAEARGVTDEHKRVARALDAAGCTNEGLFALLVSTPVDVRIEPLARAVTEAAAKAAIAPKDTTGTAEPERPTGAIALVGAFGHVDATAAIGTIRSAVAAKRRRPALLACFP